MKYVVEHSLFLSSSHVDSLYQLPVLLLVVDQGRGKLSRTTTRSKNWLAFRIAIMDHETHRLPKTQTFAPILLIAHVDWSVSAVYIPSVSR
jgi:hypothetical protein